MKNKSSHQSDPPKEPPLLSTASTANCESSRSAALLSKQPPLTSKPPRPDSVDAPTAKKVFLSLSEYERDDTIKLDAEACNAGVLDASWGWIMEGESAL